MKLQIVFGLVVAAAFSASAQNIPYSSLHYDKTGHASIMAAKQPEGTTRLFVGTNYQVGCHTDGDQTECSKDRANVVQALPVATLEDGSVYNKLGGTIRTPGNKGYDDPGVSTGKFRFGTDDPLADQMHARGGIEPIEFHYALVGNTYCIAVPPNAKGKLPKFAICYPMDRKIE